MKQKREPSEILFSETSILVVDDVEINRAYIQDALLETNLSVFEAEDGEQAFRIAKKNKPKLILTDLRMPVMDGFELLKNLRKDNDLKDIPVIAYTASAMVKQQEQILGKRL